MSLSLNTPQELNVLLGRLRVEAPEHRLTLNLIGSPELTYPWLSALYSLSSFQRLFFLGGVAHRSLRPQLSAVIHEVSWKSARAELGGTLDGGVIDLYEGLHPDALGAILGTVRGGGLVTFLSPPTPPIEGHLNHTLRIWSESPQEVTQRLWARVWASLAPHRDIIQGTPSRDQLRITLPPRYRLTHPPLQALEPEVASSYINSGPSELPIDIAQDEVQDEVQEEVIDQLQPLTRSPEQVEAIKLILSCQRRAASTAVVLTAHRGRGKSSALGLSAAALLLTGEGEICVTAPSLYAAEPIFERCVEALELTGFTVRREAGVLRAPCGVLRFIPPIDLWSRSVSPKTLFIDEAAALPVPLLERLLETKPKLAFATTTHGYEGTGRGFSLRFRPQLVKKIKKVRTIEMSTPIRWADGDPLERWLFDALLLDALPAERRTPIDPTSLNSRVWDREALSEDEPVLRMIFGLLITAHYKTQPSDLWRLLDAPNLSVHTLEDDRARVIAVALVSAEGGLSPSLAAELYEGRVRPRGQLFAANLSVHLNCEEGARMKVARVVRIATLPTLQSQGGGRRLLTEVTRWAERAGFDLIGASFGATQQLARFWIREGFIPLRASVRQSHVSGERSLLVSRGLTPSGIELMAQLRSSCARDIRDQLIGPLSTLDPLLIITLLRALPTPSTPPLDQIDERGWRAVAAVTYAGRPFELIMGPSRHLVLHWIYSAAERDTNSPPRESINQNLTRLLVMKALQGQRWLEVTRELHLDSPSVAMKGLTWALRTLFESYAPQWASQFATRFPRHGKEIPLDPKLNTSEQRPRSSS